MKGLDYFKPDRLERRGELITFKSSYGAVLKTLTRDFTAFVFDFVPYHANPKP